MQTFRKILFVSNGTDGEQDGLSQALILAFKNKSSLKVLISYPQFPTNLTGGLQNYEDFLIDKLKAMVSSTCKILKLNNNEMDISYIAEGGQSPALRIIRHVLRDSYDLVVKQIESTGSKNGFRAMDMELLRKCPCLVFLCRGNNTQVHKLNIAVAIDAESADSVGHDLSIQLIQLAQEVASINDANLSIISCWFYEYETELSEGSWYAISKDALQRIVNDLQEKHKSRLDYLIKESGISGNYKIYPIKGRPDKEIPHFVHEHKIDILIMGTVARTGIQGLLIGNTAENILQQLDCSLLAKKPNGFISTVKSN